MKLAWRELVRRPSRFLTAGVALAFFVLLFLTVLGGILDALVDWSTGLLGAQPAPLIVYSADSEGSIDRSRVSAEEHEVHRRTCRVSTRPPASASHSWRATSRAVRSPPTLRCSATRRGRRGAAATTTRSRGTPTARCSTPGSIWDRRSSSVPRGRPSR